ITREYLRNQYCLVPHLRRAVIESPIAQKAEHRSMTPEPLDKILGDSEADLRQAAGHNDYRNAARNVVLLFQHSKSKKRRPTLKDAMKELRNIRQQRFAANAETKRQLSQH
ncbi:MAG: hypothetical protein AAF562_00225, partial [Pseudomonadota bacterium]